MRKQRGVPAAPAVRIKREQPRLQWRRRPLPDRIDGEWAAQLLLDGKLLGEVAPVILGNPRRGLILGYVFYTYAADDLHLPAIHSGDGRMDGEPVGASAEERATACADLARYVQGCLRARGLRP